MRSQLALILSVLFYISGAQAENLSFMTHVIKPLSWIDQGREFHGLAYELCAMTMRRMGVDPPEVMLYPFARALHTVETQDDMVLFPVARTPDREDAVKWVGPLVSNGVYFYQRSDSTNLVHNIDDLKRLNSIGVGNSNASMILLSQQGFKNLYPVNDEIQALQMLALKRVDAVAVGEIVFQEAERSGEFGSHPFKKIDIKLYNSDLYMAFSKDVSDQEIQRWQRQLNEVKKAHYQALYDRYIR